MENKLQQLTDKLYAEGLEKGKNEGAAILARAQKDAEQIISKAKENAVKIEADARAKAQDIVRTVQADVRLASLQTVAALKNRIETSITASTTHAQVSEAFKNGDLTKDLIIEAVRAWNPSEHNTAKVVVPQGYLDQARAAVASWLDQGVELVTDGRVKVPFRISAHDGGYYVSFTPGDFENLLSSSLRPMVSDLLFGDKTE